MSAPDYARAARNLRVLGDTMHTQVGDDCLHAAELCEAVPAIEALLLELTALRGCPPGEEDWDALCIAEDRVRKALQP